MALIFIQIQYSTNQRVISSLADDKTDIISSVMQVAIDEIEDITLDILSSNDVQNYTMSEKSSKESLQHIRNVAELFSSYQVFRPYIETVYIRFVNSETLTIGNVQELFTESYFYTQDKIIKGKRGRLHLSSYPGKPDLFIASREIRKIKNLDQDHLASLYMVINWDKILDIYFRKYRVHNIKSFLLQGVNSYYSYNNQLGLNVMREAAERDEGVHFIGDSYYYLNSVKIDNTDWRFYILLPFSDIIKLRNILMYSSIITLLLGVIGLVYWGRNWSRKVTSPIMSLADSMEELQKIDFSDRSYLLPEYNRQGDEIAVLYNNFSTLLKKIDTLIHENYLKQILIKETQLKNLLTQINPHFIYNTLDTISWMAVDNNTEKITEMVQALALLLRASISSEKIIPLEREIDLLEGYCNIQKVRFEERLIFNIRKSCDIEGMTVPGMILQPLVENSIKYSLNIPKSIVNIDVSIDRAENHLVIIVKDNGPGLSKNRLYEVFENDSNESIGLKNIRDRLNIFYGDRGSLDITSESGTGTEVIIKIPIT